MNEQETVVRLFKEICYSIGKAQGMTFAASCAVGILIPVVFNLNKKIKKLESRSADTEKVAILFDVMNQRICDLEDKLEEKES